MADAVVVGSGPNGLAAAVLMARAGIAVEVFEASETVGGGCRTAELTLPGYHHDICAGAHPMAVASPFFRAFDLAAHGVDLLTPEISYGHPLDGGDAALAWRDLDRTVEGLGSDGPAWRRLFEPLLRHPEAAVALAMSDYRHIPRDLITAVRFGRRVFEQASPAWNLRFSGDRAAALFTGVSAHAIIPPQAFSAAGVALLLGTLAHADGWAIPRGGSQAIVDALIDDLLRHGGRVHTGHRVTSLDEFATADAVLLDTAPTELLRIARLPRTYRNMLQRYRFGGAACKVDFALSGPVPWRATDLAAAGTVHVVGSRAEAVVAEQEVASGRHASRPYVLVIQPGVVDDSRAPADSQTLYAYAHVPNGSARDVSGAVIAQIERFAPGFRDLIQATHVCPATRMPDHNPNYVGGDIAAGAMTLRQTVFRPTPRWNPYSTPLPGVYLCSSGTPPGPGVHGMCGMNAARHALRDRFGIRSAPEVLLRTPALV
ncbi:phytoene desaturase family protein [Nocardia vermiculata]|uniref:Pyridine nucleotide-disulfide oxidoreductase domain-containing protein 2 n=1 Tax=Nocardia vermiculata TaxID=257274 RepID=A0A846XQ30_9NOCA|nr:NAD(P)/FAD-dependent oxidoreductase [Nocardia vermiculata]NKY49136.1 NAD(P)/FAD-dependent oxidoreductase [Nocardia vermiculata]